MKIKRVIVGLEVHLELRTRSKMFCSCPANHFGREPNSQTCPVCLGLPGALPVPNRKAIEWTILLGQVLGGEVQQFARFDRKNYFYPDLPKGYQISQYELPFILGGGQILDSGKEIHIRRVHLEEDTGKLIHQRINGKEWTLIDFNRSGVPLVEIVSEPDLSSSNDAKEYLEKLHQLIRYLGISDADMEKGSLRLEPNVNLEIEDEGKLFYTPIVEIKNINSFRFAKRAIDYEVERQMTVFQEKRVEKTEGNKETRGWDEKRGGTVSQRVKEEASDYRYFPEPDIPPIRWSEKEVAEYKAQSTKIELPRAKKERFVKEYELTDYQTNVLTQEREMADFFEETVRLGRVKNVLPTEVANVIINRRFPAGLSAVELADFVASSKEKVELSREELDRAITEAIEENPATVEGFRKGKPQALGAIVGQIRQKTGVVVSIEEIIKRIKKD
ncbi:MAG TPA: Asp-tRNA(Asn)/Glu-tRNA(Gln) amidotransferase subunit GatB [Patescibacteria group bacterium]|nr:Asp-tRNA(Asn)/Glu-tRNA(Gln) amidotransferase subunit GatB [Patescibacteria group bacterium]